MSIRASVYWKTVVGLDDTFQQKGQSSDFIGLQGRHRVRSTSLGCVFCHATELEACLDAPRNFASDDKSTLSLTDKHDPGLE